MSLIVPILNPYGWHYPNQLFWSLIPTEGNLAYNSKVFAYTPTFKLITPFHAFALYANLAIVMLAALYVFNLKKKKIEWSSLLSNLVFASLYTLYFRTTFFWAPVFAFSAIALLNNFQLEFGRSSLKTKSAMAFVVLVSIFGMSADALHSGFTEPEQYVQAGHFGISFHNPVDSAEYIQRHSPRGRIGNTYINGAYLLWRFWPEAKVLIDPRHFPYKEWSDAYLTFHNGGHFYSFTHKYQADIWCIGNGNVDLYSRFLYSPDWKLAFYGRGSSVFIPAQEARSGDTPFEVAPHILETDNIYVLSTVYLFALKSHDWTTAESLLAKMEASFDVPRNQSVLSAAKVALAGMRALTNKEYPRAIDLLGNYPQSFKIEIAVSHLQRAQSFMNVHQFEQARQHAYAALEADPGFIGNYFNAALLDWVLYEHQPSYHSDLVQKSLLKKLNHFIALAQNEAGLEAYIKISQAIVSGIYKNTRPLPALIIPQFHNP